MPAFSDGMPHEDILEQQITDFFVYFHLFFHKQYLLKQFFRLAKVEKITREKNVKRRIEQNYESK